MTEPDRLFTGMVFMHLLPFPFSFLMLDGMTIYNAASMRCLISMQYS